MTYERFCSANLTVFLGFFGWSFLHQVTCDDSVKSIQSISSTESNNTSILWVWYLGHDISSQFHSNPTSILGLLSSKQPLNSAEGARKLEIGFGCNGAYYSGFKSADTPQIRSKPASGSEMVEVADQSLVPVQGYGGLELILQRPDVALSASSGT